MATCNPSARVVYNGIEFPHYADVQAQISNVYNSAGTEIKYVQYRIVVSAILGSGDCGCVGGSPVGQDNLIASYRAALSVPGAALILRNVGLGWDLHIHDYLATGADPNDRWDVVYGPKPMLIEWQPIGGNQAAIVTWTCEFRLRPCFWREFPPRSTTAPLPLGLDPYVAEFNYSQAWSTTNGIITRTTEGFLEITGSHAVPTGLPRTQSPRNADLYWDRVLDAIPAPSDDFDRRHTRTESADARVLQFTITDTQYIGDNAIFPFIHNPDINYTISSADQAMAQWQCTLSGSFVVSEKIRKLYAWELIWIMYREKTRGNFAFTFGLGREKAYGAKSGQREIEARPTANEKRSVAMVTNLTITEGLFNRTVSFSLSWLLINSFKYVLPSTGMFRPMSAAAIDAALQGLDMSKLSVPMKGVQTMPRYGWAGWQVSLDDLFRGFNAYRSDGSRTIQTLCTFALETAMQPPGKEQLQELLRANETDLIVPPEHSYIDAEQRMSIESDTGTVPHEILKKPKVQKSQRYEGEKQNFHKLEAQDGLLGYLDSGLSDDPNFAFQKEAQQSVRVRWEGAVVRVGRNVAKPELLWLGENQIKCEMIEDDFEWEVIGKMNNQNLYLGRWSQLYYLERTPSGDLDANYGAVGDIMQDLSYSPNMDLEADV